MPALNFQKKFQPMILSGAKTFTLRVARKDGRYALIGQPLYLFSAMRTKQCKKFAEKRCMFTVTIRLCYGWISIPGFLCLVLPDQLEIFAKADGFADYAAFCEFHKIVDGMTIKELRLTAWVTRDELKNNLQLIEE